MNKVYFYVESEKENLKIVVTYYDAEFNAIGNDIIDLSKDDLGYYAMLTDEQYNKIIQFLITFKILS